MKIRSLILLSAIVPLIASCAGTETMETKDIEHTKIYGTEFGHDLARGYKALALYEDKAMGDHSAADYFVQKALLSSKNLFVEPSLLEEYEIPEEKQAEMKKARSELVTALMTRKIQENYRPLASAQVQFDCWLESSEEKNGEEEAEACRKSFYSAMDEVADNLVVARSFSVLFDVGDSEPQREYMNTINEVAILLKKNTNTNVTLTGSTDTRGSAEYNKALSLKRASAVADMLENLGIAKDRIEIDASGEKELAVQTPDNTDERKNRRVDMLIIKKSK